MTRARRQVIRWPRIGPVRDPLQLWYLEWKDARGQVWRRYFADRAEARAGLKRHRAEARS